mgnify:CR=1 FL=1
MSHRKFCAVALTAVGALALTALGVSPASAAGAGAAAATSSLQPATTLAPTIGVPTTVRMAKVDGRGPWPVLYL